MYNSDSKDMHSLYVPIQEEAQKQHLEKTHLKLKRFYLNNI